MGANLMKMAGKYLKPYQGLKRIRYAWNMPTETRVSRKIPKTLSGIETLLASPSPGGWRVPENT